MNLGAAYAQLQLPCVEIRATVQKLRAQHLLVPFPGALAIADWDIDVLDQRHPGHGFTSCHRVCAPLAGCPDQDGHHYNSMSTHGDSSPAEGTSPVPGATFPGV